MAAFDSIAVVPVMSLLVRLLPHSEVGELTLKKIVVKVYFLLQVDTSIYVDSQGQADATHQNL